MNWANATGKNSADRLIGYRVAQTLNLFKKKSDICEEQ